MQDYGQLIADGSNLLNSGKTQDALDHFLFARQTYQWTHRGVTNAEVEQLLGICYRMLGQLDIADRCFRAADNVATDDAHRGRIKRDWAMVHVMYGDKPAAIHALDESLRLLFQAGDDGLEQATTVGFTGRVFAAFGDTSSANRWYRNADRIIRRYQGVGQERAATYELNNLVWWLKTARSIKLRWLLTRRALRLARHANHTKRQLQVLGLLACRPLALKLFG